MNRTKKIIFISVIVILSIAIFFTSYEAIGYLLVQLSTPKLVGSNGESLLIYGNTLLVITYGSICLGLLIILVTFTIIFLKKVKTKN